jgi:hypothetical protein
MQHVIRAPEAVKPGKCVSLGKVQPDTIDHDNVGRDVLKIEMDREALDHLTLTELPGVCSAQAGIEMHGVSRLRGSAVLPPLTDGLALLVPLHERGESLLEVE